MRVLQRACRCGRHDVVVLKSGPVKMPAVFVFSVFRDVGDSVVVGTYGVDGSK